MKAKDSSSFEFHPSLLGTLSVTAQTACGIPVYIGGFQGVMGIVSAGAHIGTSANYWSVSVKVQECSRLAGSGSEWSDVTDAVAGGSFKFSALGAWVGTNATLYKDQIGVDLTSPVRKPFLRMHATLTSTNGAAPKVFGGFVFHEAKDTLYIRDAESVSTGVEHTLMI